MYDDETLIECIKASGYYEFENVNLDDLPNDKRVAIILADEILALRPELRKFDSDILYIKKEFLENGTPVYSLPSQSLSTFLKEPPYDGCHIFTYSIKEGTVLKRIYKGTGTNWEKV